MSLKTRLLTTAFVLPVTGWLSLGAAMAFDLSGVETDGEVTASAATSGSDSDIGSITIGGTPGNQDAALRIDTDENVTIDGVITVRDRSSVNDDATIYDLDNGIGIKLDTALTGTNTLSLEDGAQIGIVELLGPTVDGDGDGFYDNDADEDFITEGSHAFDGNNTRIAVWIDNTIAAALIGEADSLIVVEGNAASRGDVAGVRIDAALGDNLDLSTAMNIFGDNALGVQINDTIAGTYRQRGDIDVRGEGGTAIDINAGISGALLIEGLVNATGYSTIPQGTIGSPQHGGEDTADTNEFDATRQAANPQERRRSGSSLDIGAAIAQGVIVNGQVNTALSRDENDSLQAIRDARTDDDTDNDNVTALKTDPYHYDENRARGRITSYGEADNEAALKITASLGTAAGATRETFLDTTDDDDDDTADSTDDAANIYNSTKAFFYSHGLMNRGGIEADTLYDAVKSGAYSIENKATALLIDDNGGSATIHGGIYNSGTISASANNSNAIAVDLRDIELTDGQRGDGSIFLNEGSVTATLRTHKKSYEGITASARAAIGVKIGSAVNYGVTGTPGFTNAGNVSAISIHTQDSGETDADGEIVYELVNGHNAVALDLSAVPGNFNLTQRMRGEDALVDTAAANSASNPYRGGGDADIDRTGNIGQNDDGVNINIADGVIDTRDISAPIINGDVLFGDGDNLFTMTAGVMSGKIDFGAGADSFVLGNSSQDDANAEDDDANDDIDDTLNDYTAPTTSYRGRIVKSAGTLNITAGGQTAIAGEKTLLHFDGQEGVDLNGDGDDLDAGEEAQGLAVNNLTLSENAELRFTVDPNLLPAAQAILDVTNFTMGDDATLSLDISSLVPNDREIVLLEADNDLSAYSAGLNDRAPEDAAYPFIYDVTLAIDESRSNDRLVADFALKDSDALGLNATQALGFDTVLAHFTNRPTLERSLTSLMDADAFTDAYAQLLPHYGDGTIKQLASLSQSATGAVSQHLQIVNAGGRRGGDGWIQQFGDFRKQDAGADLATLGGTSLGLAAGFDLPAGPIDAIGGFIRMSFTSVNEKTAATNEVKAESFALGAYLSDRIGPLRYEVSAAAGDVTFDSRRDISFGIAADRLIAGWDGTSTSASARLAYPILDMRHLLRLEAGMDYFSLEQDSYSEQSLAANDPELAMRLGDAESEISSNYIGLRGGMRSGGGSPSEIVWEPNYYLGYRAVQDYTPYSATANFATGSGDGFVLSGPDALDDQAEIGLGFAAHNDYFAIEFNYRGQFGDDSETHGGGISVRLLF